MSSSVVVTSAENKQNCLFCNAQLAVSTRNCFNIFKTILVPMEKKACDLIGGVLDVEITEGSVHSDVVCKKCFKLVNEFADLECRRNEIKNELTSTYAKTTELLQGNTEENKNTVVLGTPRKATHVLQGKTRVKLDADKLNQIVLGKGNTMLSKNIVLKQATEDGTELDEAKVIVVGDGDMEDIEVEEYEIGEVIEDFEVENADHEEVVAVQIKTENDGKEYIVNQQTVDGQVKHVEMDGNRFTCLLCPAEEGSKPFTCESKDLGFMTLHLKIDHDTRLYICDICGAEFRKRNDLSAHLDDHVAQEEGDFQCEVCNRLFSNLRLYRIHKRLHSSQNKSWACEICGKKYSSRNLLEEHKNTHTGVRPYVCTNCGKDFASKYTFKAHKKTHEARERNFSCSTCDKTFLSAQNLIQHEKTHSESKDYVCDHCGKGFGSLRNLEVHSVVHSGFKPFVCGVCGKAFARKAEIKDHERTHTGERPFQCEFCGAQFSQRSNLQSHKRVTHYDDRRYRCDDCGKGFKRRRLLDYHIKAVHTGERPYKCPTCDATFVYPEHFKKHIRIHSGIKPYKCEVCGKAFNSRDNRNAHRFVHSDKKPYECLVCGMGFMRKPLLYNHMQQVGHINDTIVVNQPRLTTEDDQELTSDREVDIEMTIVEDNGIAQEGVLDEKPKLYLTELNEHVIIQGDEKTLFMADGMKIKTLNEDGENEQLVDEEGNFVDMDGNIIEIEQLVDDNSIAMTAHINEHGQLVNDQGQIINEHGQILTDDGQPLVVDETVSFAEEADVIVKGEKSDDDYPDKKPTVHYVEIRLPDDTSSDQKTWFNIIENDEAGSNG
ncbi:UNVERIFIED_CONTAM: hypothetical protein PYX00_006506 [Menopon gallinae]|uniref:C2H2-type domain-containing protein n=1 Tax=Menopon gallinae TaxID=328185 RepID=A0AAW2HVA7_9NEOP